MELGNLDWLFLAVLLVSMLLGAWRGLTYEVLSLLAWGVAFAVAQLFAGQMAAWMPLSAASESTRYFAGFGAVFVLTLVACALTIALLTKLLTAVGLRPIDRALGALFGLLRGLVLSLALVLVVALTPVRDNADWNASLSVQILQGVYRTVRPVLPSEFSRYLPD